MPLDGSVLYSLISEFKDKLLGYKIEKVLQPEKDEIILQLRGYKDSVKLLLTANASYPRCHITQADRENPKVPPAFCMLLRKHLTGAKILEFLQPEYERILEIKLDCFDDLGYSSRKSLVLEIMGRHSNLILMETESRLIIDSIKHVDEFTSSVREVLPGVHYVAPPSSEKVDPLVLDRNLFQKSISEAGGTLEKALVKTYNGMSPFAGRVLCQEAGLDPAMTYTDLAAGDNDRLADSYISFFQRIKNGTYEPSVSYFEGKPYDFFCFNPPVFRELEVRSFPSMSGACEAFYHEKDRQDRIRQKAGDLLKLLSNRIDRAERKLAALAEDMERAKDCEKYKRYGDVLMSALHEIKEPKATVYLTDYYSEALESVAIPFDVRYSPVVNAQRYYKQYTKRKNAQILLEQQLAETSEELLYLENQVFNIENCRLELELNEVRSELASLGFMKSSGKPSKKKEKPSTPLHMVSSSGLDIYIGRNNVQNENLTMKNSYSSDIWLHIKNFPGSHVVIRTNGKEVDDESLLEAARYAAQYSKASRGGKVEVDYTAIKNVKKPKGSKPGMVIYTNYKTIVIN